MATPPLSAPEVTTPQVTTSQVVTARSVGYEFLRAIWIFQAGCAVPTLLILGTLAFFQLFDSTIPLYDFITYLGNTILSAGIIFLVVVQRRISLGSLDELRFEAAKAFLASAMWLWLFLDALLAHKNCGSWYEDQRPRKVIRAVIASVLLWILFYPPLVYAGWVWMETRARRRDDEEQREGEAGADADAGEETHLLDEGA